MSNAALHHVWKHSKAKGVALLVMIAIADMANDEGDCWPGRTSLAEKCRISERYSQVITNKLAAMGELEVFVQNGIDTSTGKTNRYHVVGVNSDSPRADQRGESGITPGANGDSPDPSIDPSVEEQPSNDPSPSDAPGEPTGADGDDELQQLILPEVRKLHLPPDDQQALLALGHAQALAIAWAARKGHNPGGLAKHLMASGGPPDEVLERAQIAIQHKTLDDQVIDRHLRAGDLDTLSADVKACLYAKLPEEPPDESLTKPVQAERSIWQAYKETLSTLEYDPRVSPESYALLTGLRLVRFDDVARVLVVTGEPSAARLLEQNLAWRTGEPITVHIDETEEVST